MSSPSDPTNDPSKDVDMDNDAEMEDTQDAAPRAANDLSSSTLDHDFAPAETSGGPASSAQNRKDVTLREFLSKMDDYAPIIPDAVTAHYLTLAGLPPPSASDPTGASTNTTPLPLARLLALATQKFIADIAADAYQYSRIRSSNTASSANPLSMAGGAGVPGAAPGQGGAAGKQGTQLGVQRSGYGGGGQGSGQGKTVLTMEDLGVAMQEYGVNIKRGEFYR